MPISFSPTAKQTQRIQEAVDIINAREGTSLTAKQWAWRELKLIVKQAVLSGHEDTAYQTLVDAVNTDMED